MLVLPKLPLFLLPPSCHVTVAQQLFLITSSLLHTPDTCSFNIHSQTWSAILVANFTMILSLGNSEYQLFWLHNGQAILKPLFFQNLKVVFLQSLSYDRRCNHRELFYILNSFTGIKRDQSNMKFDWFYRNWRVISIKTKSQFEWYLQSLSKLFYAYDNTNNTFGWFSKMMLPSSQNYHHFQRLQQAI